MAISEGTVSYKELGRSFEEQEDAAALSEHHTDSKHNNPLAVHHGIDDKYSFFNVLWVEQICDHFSRKAVGRSRSYCVEKSLLGEGQGDGGARLSAFGR